MHVFDLESHQLQTLRPSPANCHVQLSWLYLSLLRANLEHYLQDINGIGRRHCRQEEKFAYGRPFHIQARDLSSTILKRADTFW